MRRSLLRCGHRENHLIKGVGEQNKTFRKGGNVHMFANKENAWQTDPAEMKYKGFDRLREYWWRAVSRNKSTRYWLLGMLTLTVGGAAKLWALEEDLANVEGLIGPKRKKYRSRLTVVMDIDETIVSFGDKAYRMKAGLVPRPHLAELLDYLCAIDAEVILWSACSEMYASKVLQVIDPSGQRISHVITRSNRWFTKDFYYEKNLLWLKRNMNDTLLIENRPLPARNCNANTILVDEFIRAEYMDTHQDHPVNDRALAVLKEIIRDLEESGRPVPEYLGDQAKRHKAIKEIPCHLAIRQMPDELARGVFYFLGDKYLPGIVQR